MCSIRRAPLAVAVVGHRLDTVPAAKECLLSCLQTHRSPGPPERVSSAGGPATEAREIRYSYSQNLPAVLQQTNSSLLVSTYRTGNLVRRSAPRGQLAVSFHTFERPMGMAVRPGWLVVGARTQIWSLRNFPDLAARLEPRGHYDACYLTRFSHFTGNIQCHELAWVSPPRGPNVRGCPARGTSRNCGSSTPCFPACAPPTPRTVLLHGGARRSCPPWCRKTAVI